jgi:hypothetical protein
MDNQRKWPVTLTVDVEPEGLKHIVEEGRLLEFVDAFSALADAHIKVQIVDKLAEAAVGQTDLSSGMHIAVGFWVDDPYGTPPKPWPRPHRWIRDITNIVQAGEAQLG